MYSKECYVLMQYTLLDGVIPIGMTTENGRTYWTTFETEREAQLDLVEDLEEHIRQFKAGERDFDEIYTGMFVEKATQVADDILVIDKRIYHVDDFK